MISVREMGCLVIDGLGGGGTLADLPGYLEKEGMNVSYFMPDARLGLHSALQHAFQRVRVRDGVNAIVAAGAGCDCALAIAAQLPVDRLALLCPDDGCGAAGEYRRVRAYAARNAALCACDALILGWTGADSKPMRRLYRLLSACRVQAVLAGDNLWTDHKQILQDGVFRFICEGALPRSLAVNAEICMH